MIRRLRKHVLRWYGYTEDTDQPMKELSDGQARQYLDGRKRAYVIVNGKHQFFPERELETLRYSIEDTYAGLYEEIRQYLGRPPGKRYSPKPGVVLTYARYGLWHYVKADKKKVQPYQDLHRAGMNLRGLMRVMLFKRFESSVYAFRRSLERLESVHGLFLKTLDEGFVPAGGEAQRILYESDHYEETDLVDALRACSGRYDIEDFDEEKLREHLEADRQLLRKIIDLVEPITPDKDAKLQTLIPRLRKDIPQKTGKVLIFTQYADTAEYLHSNLNPEGKRRDIECIYGTDKSKARMAARFAPKANPHIKIGDDDQVQILVATDVMSEGLNLQDGDVVLNYDLHWNPVRLIQRFGRIDRIGSENDRIWGFNFLPETGLEKQLGIHEVLRRRISEINESIGEDTAILDKDEQVNDEAMYCIYEKKGDQLSLFEDEEGDYIDLNEAEEMLRSLWKDDPNEFNRIANLRDGIRAARAVLSSQGRYVFCQAGRFQQLFLVGDDGKVESRDVPTALARLKCSKTEPPAVLPAEYNKSVMAVLETFATEVKHRRAQQQHSLSLTVGQKYVLRELRAYYSTLEPEDEDAGANVARLEETFKRPVTAAVRRQLNAYRRNGMIGEALVRNLTDLRIEHGLERFDSVNRERSSESDEHPHIICSEAFA